jgi:hypothetical protein
MPSRLLLFFLRRFASVPVAVAYLFLVRCMSREQSTGRCDKCSQSFTYYLVHNGFNDSGYAYCDSCCYVAVFSHPPPGTPKMDYGHITPEIEPYLLSCPARGYFRAAAQPRCPHCDNTLDPVRATDYIEPNAPGTAKGWRWQRSWTGIYCIIIDNRVANDPWKSHECT